MCTLTYKPYKNSGFILTSSRDERNDRLAKAAIIEKKSGSTGLLYPEDPLSKGSWIGCTSKGIVGCLLNGAFESYHPSPPYRKSRGQIFLEVLESFGERKTFTSNFLDNIEPFTLILIKYMVKQRYVQELRWDGKQIHTLAIDSESPHLWASAALFDPASITEKKINFESLISERPEAEPEELFDMHLNPLITGQKYLPEFAKVEGGMVNLTQISSDDVKIRFKNKNLLTEEVTEKSMVLEEPAIPA